jgi:hypothetical protein
MTDDESACTTRRERGVGEGGKHGAQYRLFRPGKFSFPGGRERERKLRAAPLARRAAVQ